MQVFRVVAGLLVKASLVVVVSIPMLAAVAALARRATQMANVRAAMA
jgi:hypothetical protein